MIFINSPLSQFEVTNLIGIFAPILGKINIILTNLALYTTNNNLNLSLNFSSIVEIFIILLFCGIIFVNFIFISYSGRKIIEAVVKNGPTIGAGVVGVVTGLDAAFNLADRYNKSGGSNGSGESDPDKDKDKDKNKDNNKTEDTNNNTENKNNNDNKS